MLNDYPWLQPVWDNLKVGLESDRVPGALLLQSEQGLGIEKLIEFLAKHFFAKITPVKRAVFVIAVN